VAPTDIEEGMRVGVDRNKYQIHIPLPPKIDPTVTMMQVEEKPDVTYSDVGGCKEQIEKLREVVETPLLHVILVNVKSFHSSNNNFSLFVGSRRDLLILALSHPRECFFLAHLVLAKLFALEQ